MVAEIVVDASALAAIALGEPGSEQIAEILAEARSLQTTSFALFEVANALWKHRRALGDAMAERLTMIQDLNVTEEPTKDIIQDALSIAHRQNITVYDAAYIALAKKYSISLLSLDALQIKAATAEHVVLINVDPAKKRIA